MRSLTLFLLVAACLSGQPRPATSPGTFDFYVYSLSWSPDYCASPAGARDQFQCGQRRYGFVVHGLWPQFERGWPSDCATEPLKLPAALRKDVLEVMPSEKLMNHEWRKHGTCSGLTPQKYFESILSTWANIRFPERLKNLTREQVEFSPAEIEEQFVAANPGLKKNMVSVSCGGRFLKEVHVCLDRNLKFRACSAQVERGCSMSKIIVRPIR